MGGAIVDTEDDKKSASVPPATSPPSVNEESPARVKERELFQRLARVKQYPISADDEHVPDPNKG